MKQKQKQPEMPQTHQSTLSTRLLTLARRPVFRVVVIFVLSTAFSWGIMAIFVGTAKTEISSTLDNFSSPAVTNAVRDEIPTVEEKAVFIRLLDGVVTQEGNEDHWPVAVMIENLPSVRPQAGLGDASVVYEALAEGGATRFMAVFDPQVLTTPTVGPVRSSRPYYLEWLGEYDGLYAHAGGSPKALTVIREANVHDLEALGRDGKYFWRNTSRSAPHNLYTSAEKLVLALRDKGLVDTEASYVPWKFEDEALIDERGIDGTTLTFNFSYGLSYKVDWVYDRTNNSYRRFNADQPHTDENNGRQLEAKNVIVQLVQEPELDGTGKGRLDIYVGGTGDAWVAHDGQLIKATWKKESRTDRTKFYDTGGLEIPLVRGTTWVHVITKTQDVLYE
ncbi:MAG TPA: hypothetical protein DIS62_05540 [Candidatus Kerfeldbacteria bacterium]|nr:MAG: PT repeat-containing protein [Parcubacteria group bacterium GW2011_GWA2_48_9]HCM68425.1 hypothetical protein [Candidatus Kerfeldbacteria bacterium]